MNLAGCLISQPVGSESQYIRFVSPQASPKSISIWPKVLQHFFILLPVEENCGNLLATSEERDAKPTFALQCARSFYKRFKSHGFRNTNFSTF